MYKEHTDKAKGGRFEGRRRGWAGWDSGGWEGGRMVKMETTVLE